MPRVIVFDVNETLLDLHGMGPHFEKVFGQVSARQEWFSQLLHSAFLATITDVNSDFSTLAARPWS
jgi:2-haloacid dehalogenase